MAEWKATARRQDQNAAGLAANILKDDTHLVFIGPEGELPDEMSSLRELALRNQPALDDESEALSTACEPPSKLDVKTLRGEAMETGLESRHSTPANSGRLRTWQIWLPTALLAMLILGALLYLQVPPLIVLGLFIVVMLIVAVRLYPPPGAPARRLLPLLALFTLPWIISILFGPLGFVEVSWHQSERDRMIQFQGWLMAAGGILPLLVVPVMRGGRSFAVVIGILNFVITFLATSVALITNMPGA